MENQQDTNSALSGGKRLAKSTTEAAQGPSPHVRTHLPLCSGLQQVSRYPGREASHTPELE